MGRNPDEDPTGQTEPDEEREQAEESQQEAARRSRQTGGDAQAAASIEEREAVAEDHDHPFDSPPGRSDSE